MAATWRIADWNGGNARWDDGYTLEEQGITDLKLRFCNHADDVATFSCEGAALASVPEWNHGDEIAIFKDTECVFCGVITSLPRYGTGTDHRVSYEARGGWYWLTKGFYTQNYAVSDGTTAGTCAKTRVILGYGASGRVSPDTQLAEIVGQCASRTGRIAIAAHSDPDEENPGICVSSTKLPADEELDLTWAGAIDRILRWFPDTAVWFTYGTGKALCRMTRRANLASASLAVPGAEEVEVTPRYDLQVPGVRIDYEITTTVTTEGAENEGKRYRNVVSRTAGNPSAIGAARFTVQLDGGTVRELKQRVVVEALPSGAPSAANANGSAWQAFFRKYIPELEGKTFDSFTYASGGGWMPYDGATLKYVLLRGEVQPWMEGKIAREFTLRFLADYHDSANAYTGREFAVTLTLTNCQGGTYSSQTRTTAEDVPSGLAGEVYAAVGRLHYEGRYVRVGEDPPDLCLPGETLDLTGGRPEWYPHVDGGTAYEGMGASVRSVEWDAGLGRTTVDFGPPEHLGVQDLVELARANRARQAVVSQGTKASADEDDTATDVFTIGGAGPNTHEGETAGTLVKRVLKSQDGNAERTIKLDSSSNSGGERKRTLIVPGKITCGNTGENPISFPADFDSSATLNSSESPGMLLVLTGEPVMTGWSSRGSLTVGFQVPCARLIIKGGLICGVSTSASPMGMLTSQEITFLLPYGEEGSGDDSGGDGGEGEGGGENEGGGA
ncbi:MAG: hypothetical protein IJS32_00335 [Kiritimatiellae bacterium]|nr:hypothetical protein [Kiritimatiellia bacterium]